MRWKVNKQVRGSVIVDTRAKEFSVADSAGPLDDMTPGVVCYGDSGGPMFHEVDGQLSLVGVTSRGQAGCMGQAEFTRVSAWSSLILSAIDNERDVLPDEPPASTSQPRWKRPDDPETGQKRPPASGSVFGSQSEPPVEPKLAPEPIVPKPVGSCTVSVSDDIEIPFGALVLGMSILCVRRKYVRPTRCASSKILGTGSQKGFGVVIAPCPRT